MEPEFPARAPQTTDENGTLTEAMYAPTDSPEATAAVSPNEPPRRALEDILRDLARPIPDRLLATKTLQGHEITYVPWYRAQQLLDHYCGSWWDYRIIDTIITAEHLITQVEIRIRAADGQVRRQGRGIEELSVKGFGDPASNSEAQAFRRACARLGLGLHLYYE